MMSVPQGIVLFFLGLLISLVSYIWVNLSKRLDSLEREFKNLDPHKCRDCEPVTEKQMQEILVNEFNKFRLELYKSGVLKATPVRKSNKGD
ncbi:MAG TPA: hypothetical protein PK726_02655 [Candidatus Cloacimonadota bacterium]|nr:hypothetical protein [Candidatus Cloacimonadota bacterium]